jgi:hypothetical protein
MKHSTTIVSCYYPLECSKHSIEEYKVWIQQFLSFVNTPIVMFSDGETYDWLYQLRKEAGLLDEFFLIRKPLSALEFSTPEWDAIWDHQSMIGHWKDQSFQKAFRIWANKSYFVQEAIQKDPFESDFFVWCDAGCWRDLGVCRTFAKDWPSPKALRPNRILLLVIESMDALIQKLNDPEIQTHEDVVTKVQTCHKWTVGGTILAGDKNAWALWTPLFRQTLEYFVKHNLFAGDDQAVIGSTYLWMLKSQPQYAPITFVDPIGRGLLVLVEGKVHWERWYQLQILLSQEFAHRLS